jgi:hypothetical protein
MYISRDVTPCWERDVNDMRVNDPNLWFAKQDTRAAGRARELCMTQCKERLECLASVLKFEQTEGIQHGIFGGLSEYERRRLLKKELKRQKPAA